MGIGLPYLRHACFHIRASFSDLQLVQNRLAGCKCMRSQILFATGFPLCILQCCKSWLCICGTSLATV